MKAKKIILTNIPYFFIGLYASKLFEGWRLAEGADASQKFLHYMQGLGSAFESPLPSFYPTDLILGLCLAFLLRLAVHIKGKNAKKFRKNTEYGSARWSA